MSSTALRQAMVILRSLCTFLVSQNYLVGSPFAGVSLPREVGRALGSRRPLTFGQWGALEDRLDEILVDAISSTDDNNVDPVDGAISELPIRMNPVFSDTFMGEMASFSSRGPVQGLGQVKPDISAPGVSVLAAAPPGSVPGQGH